MGKLYSTILAWWLAKIKAKYDYKGWVWISQLERKLGLLWEYCNTLNRNTYIMLKVDIY